LTSQPTPNTAESARSWKRPESQIGGNDLPIAAHAYAIGATIVTANTNEFKRTRGRTWRIGSLESGWFRKSKSIKT
jgi:predicted nucleic acid-binding protein